MSTLATPAPASTRISAPEPAPLPALLDQLVDLVREDLVTRPGPVDVPRITRVMRANGQVTGPAELLATTALVRDHIDGLGPLEPLLAPGVTDILVNDDGTVWIDDADGLHRTALHLGAEQARALAARLATAGGRRLDDAMPWADAHLPSGIRFHAVLPPLSPGGTVISLRIPAHQQLSLTDLERLGAFPHPAADLLRRIVRSRRPFLITGGTGTGKSTLLAALLAEADSCERIVVVEDALELRIDHPHVVHLQSRHANTDGAGGVDLAVLVRQSLRMRPDRVVLGECRGGEIRDLLQALNTGHDGGCGTVHANTVADVPARLEALGALGGLDRASLAAQAASALDVVLHLQRTNGQRRLSEIGLLQRDGDGSLASAAAYRIEAGELVPGPAHAALDELLAGEDADPRAGEEGPVGAALPASKRRTGRRSA